MSKERQSYRLSRMPAGMKLSISLLKREMMVREIPWSMEIPPDLAEEAGQNFREIIKRKDTNLIVTISDPGSRILTALTVGHESKDPTVKLLEQKKIDIRITGDLEDRFLKDHCFNPQEIYFVNDAGVMAEPEYKDLVSRYQRWLKGDDEAQRFMRKVIEKIAGKDIIEPLKVIVVNDCDYTGGMEITARELIVEAAGFSKLPIESMEMINFFEKHPVSLPGTGWIGSVCGGGILGATLGKVFRERRLVFSQNQIWAINTLLTVMIEQGVKGGDIQLVGQQIRRKFNTENPAKLLAGIIGEDGLLNFRLQLYQAFEKLGGEI